MEIRALCTTFILMFSFLVGYLSSRIFIKKKDIIKIITPLLFVVLLGNLLLDLIAKEVEYLEFYNIFLTIGIVIATFSTGLLCLFFMRKMLYKKTTEKETQYIKVIMAAASLLLYNILTGVLVYNRSMAILKDGVLLAFRYGVFNIVFGLFMGINLVPIKKSKKSIVFILTTLSYVIGSFIIFILKIDFGPMFYGIITCMTIGMIVYLLIFELFDIIINNIKDKEIIRGIVIGFIVFLVSLIL